MIPEKYMKILLFAVGIYLCFQCPILVLLIAVVLACKHFCEENNRE